MKTKTLPFVTIRELSLLDVEDRYQWCLDRDVTKHLNMPAKYPPFTREETMNWIQMCITRKNGYEQRAIVTGEGQHIGWVDLKNIDQLNGHAELGIAIGDKRYWGKGYGMSALKAMLHLGFTELSLNKIWLRVEVDNGRAIKSYKQCGFVEEGILREDRYREGKYVDRVRMSILRREVN
ncbi:GNAT family N-acetyltransferase [Alkalihalobacillus hwajinpoensis]|uniref:GNAT family N-acetyltransferase n=1 Tax=Guptibacillus hwajinpoensis TaxID=208199 RepID=UPI001883735B|nr:GNAT family protein [Pseudalkalibacillus hwajinpoensis]MBF0709153.1 GNAT family N-acetyltransferase [Pseudalkalibacillus hwajinpoensis]